MSKIRPPFTAAYALRRAMELVPLPRIAAAVGRTESLVYKWSDPDEEKKISFENAVIIDNLCIDLAGIAPFFEVLKANFNLRGYVSPPATIRETVLMSQAALGLFAERVLQATSPASESGAVIAPRERQELMLAIDHLRQKLSEAERSIIAASKI